jgi:hypothetical protein
MELPPRQVALTARSVVLALIRASQRASPTWLAAPLDRILGPAGEHGWTPALDHNALLSQHHNPVCFSRDRFDADSAWAPVPVDGPLTASKTTFQDACQAA